MMLETWLQLALQEYLIYFYYYDVRLASSSQNLSLLKSKIILVPLTMKAIMPEDTFTKLLQETWIIAIKRMVWVTFLYIAMIFTFLSTMLSCIASLEQPIKLWMLSSSIMISGFFFIMSFRKSGYGRIKCYILCFMFFQFGVLWILSIIGKNLQELSFKDFIIYYLDDSSYVPLSAVIVVVFVAQVVGVCLRSLGMTQRYVPFQSIKDIFSNQVRLFAGLVPEPLRRLMFHAVLFC